MDSNSKSAALRLVEQAEKERDALIVQADNIGLEIDNYDRLISAIRTALPTLGLLPPREITVRSETDYSTYYNVTRNAYGVYACTCPAFKFRVDDVSKCKHINKVIADKRFG